MDGLITGDDRGLCISRKPGEKVDILLETGEVITLSFYEILPNRCRVRVSAPKSARILRREIRLKLASESGATNKEVVHAA